MGKTVQDVMVRALMNLGKTSFKSFKNKLNDWEFKEGYSQIPYRKLEEADEEDVAKFIINYYKESYGIEVTLGILEAIDERQAAENLRTALKTACLNCQGKNKPYRETAVNISPTEFIAEHNMASSHSAKATVPSGLVPQVIRDNKYRIEVDSTFHCLKTGIKFEVEFKAIIEYSVQYDNDYMNLIQKKGYELLGPIFNVHVVSGAVSAVHLPHYVCLDGFREQSMVKLGHFKDGNVILEIPTRIETSYIILKYPKFSFVAAIGEQHTSIWGRNQPYPITGKVILYFRTVCPKQDDIMEYRIHLYLLPAGIPCLKDLDDLKRDHGFTRVDKPSHTTSSVYTKTNYTISLIGEEQNPYIWPKVLQFMIYKEIRDHPFTEINISKNAILKSANTISLQVLAEKSSESEPVWEGRLSRADIEELTEVIRRGWDPLSGAEDCKQARRSSGDQREGLGWRLLAPGPSGGPAIAAGQQMNVGASQQPGGDNKPKRVRKPKADPWMIGGPVIAADQQMNAGTSQQSGGDIKRKRVRKSQTAPGPSGGLTIADGQQMNVGASQQPGGDNKPKRVRKPKTDEEEHFVTENRTHLIRSIANFDPVLDDLMGKKFLTHEEYDRIRIKGTSQEKMRELYNCVRSWGNRSKDIFLKILEKHNSDAIKTLLEKSKRKK